MLKILEAIGNLLNINLFGLLVGVSLAAIAIVAAPFLNIRVENSKNKITDYYILFGCFGTALTFFLIGFVSSLIFGVLILLYDTVPVAIANVSLATLTLVFGVISLVAGISELLNSVTR